LVAATFAGAVRYRKLSENENLKQPDCSIENGESTDVKMYGLGSDDGGVIGGSKILCIFFKEKRKKATGRC
jgi:hypothetical protein